MAQKEREQTVCVCQIDHVCVCECALCISDYERPSFLIMPQLGSCVYSGAVRGESHINR